MIDGDAVETQKNAADVGTQKLWDLSDKAHYRMWKARKALRLAFDECCEAEKCHTEAVTKAVCHTEASITARLLDPEGAGC